MFLRTLQLICVLALGCSPEIRPCLTWLDPGQAYDLTLGRIDPVMYGDAMPPHSCGPTFDLVEGDTVAFNTIAPENSATVCNYIDASVDSTIRKVSLGKTSNIGPTTLPPHLQAGYAAAKIGESGCRGRYGIGINEVDNIVRGYRFFITETPLECAAEGINVTEEESWCWDSWRAQVTDSNGTIVATSLE